MRSILSNARSGTFDLIRNPTLVAWGTLCDHSCHRIALLDPSYDRGVLFLAGEFATSSACDSNLVDRRGWKYCAKLRIIHRIAPVPPRPVVLGRLGYLAARADVWSSVAVLLAAIGSYVVHSRWPDIVAAAVVLALHLAALWQQQATSIESADGK